MSIESIRKTIGSTGFARSHTAARERTRDRERLAEGWTETGLAAREALTEAIRARDDQAAHRWGVVAGICTDEAIRTRRAAHRKRTWTVGVPALVVVAALAAGLAYVHHLNTSAPAPLTFANAPSASAPGTQPYSGTSAPSTPTSAASTAQSSAPAGAVVGTAAGGPQTSTPSGAAVTGAAVTGAAVTGAAVTTAGSTPVSAAPRPPSPVDGRWTVGTGSVAGYRIGYSSPVGNGTRVGRTNTVPGAITIAGTTVQTGQFSVDMRTVHCDAGSTCDAHVNEIMDTSQYPNETFVLSSPIQLGSIPAEGQQVTVPVTGLLTLRGVTHTTTFTVQARRDAGRIEVLGSIPVNRDDYKIPDSNEPGFTIDKKGTIEFLLLFDHQA